MRIVWCIISSILCVGSVHAQSSRKLIESGASYRTYLDTESIDYDSTGVMTFKTIQTDLAGKELRVIRNEFDCEMLRYRREFAGKLVDWQTALGAFEQAVHPTVCGLWEPGRWTFMFDNDNDVYVLDRATVDTVPKMRTVRRVWVKISYEPPREATGSRRKASEKLRYDMDCGSRRMRRVAYVEYDSAGAALESMDVDPDSAKWHSVIPESLGESMYDWICRELPRLNRFLALPKRGGDW